MHCRPGMVSHSEADAPTQRKQNRVVILQYPPTAHPTPVEEIEEIRVLVLDVDNLPTS